MQKKYLTKVQHQVLIKTHRKLGLARILLNLIKHTYEEPVNITLRSERLSPKIRGKLSVQHCTGGSNLWIRQKNKRPPAQKGRKQPSRTDDTIIHVENPKNPM